MLSLQEYYYSTEWGLVVLDLDRVYLELFLKWKTCEDAIMCEGNEQLKFTIHYV